VGSLRHFAKYSVDLLKFSYVPLGPTLLRAWKNLSMLRAVPRSDLATCLEKPQYAEGCISVRPRYALGKTSVR